MPNYLIVRGASRPIMERLKWRGSLAAEREYSQALAAHPPVTKKQAKKAKKHRPKKKFQPVKHPWIPYKDYLVSKWWLTKRKQKIKSVGGKCERCGACRGLQVHHLHYKTLWREKNTDLEVLCGACHEKEHEHTIRMKNHIDSIQRQE